MKVKSVCQLFLLICALGCSQSSNNATVQGTVTIDGVLATRGTVTFHPVEKGPVAIGQIHSDGSYALRTGLGNTVDPDAANIAAGKYVVTVMVMGDSSETEMKKDDGSPPNAGPRLTALKYASKETSKLQFTVEPKRNVIPLELDSAATDPPPEPKEEEVELSTDEVGGGELDEAKSFEGNSELSVDQAAAEETSPEAEVAP